MATNSTKEEELRRYLLGEMSDEEREAVEERFISDDSLFDELKALEDELYLEYTAGEMAASDKKAFEAKYLRTREDRNRLAFADAFLEVTGDIAEEKRVSAAEATNERTSFLSSIGAFFGLSMSPLQIGMAAALVLMAVGLGFVAIQNAALRREVARFDADQQQQKDALDRQLAEKSQRQAELERQLADEQSRAQMDQQRISEIEAERSRLRNEVEEARRRSEQLRPLPARPPAGQTPSRSIIALALSPGRLVRGGNDPDASRISITPATRQVRLSLDLKKVDPHAAYRVIIRNVDTDAEAYSSGDIKARGGRVTVHAPANQLIRGDYEITLYGVTPENQTQELTRYYFSVAE